MKAHIFTTIFTTLFALCAHAQDIPFVFNAENTCTQTPELAFASMDKLKPQATLPNPFRWASRRGEVKTMGEWHQRRNEIIALLQHYEIGEKPSVSREQMSAEMRGDTLVVSVTRNSATLTLHAILTYPDSVRTGSYPAIIGIGMPSGSLPRDIFQKRGVAMISYNFNEVMRHTQKRGEEPFNRLYPELLHVGSYMAWPWGVSRIIDGLEMVGEASHIDTQRLAVSGCSFAGKMALFSGALDERIALTIAQEPGGGGAAAWRVSETLGQVETIERTNYSWFMESMKQFEKDNVTRLPIDHHELCALVAPRALLILGNPDYEWLADEAAYVSCQAARKVWARWGIEDRMGYSFQDKHGHCQLPDSQRPEVEAFVDRFLLGKAVNTNITFAPMFEKVNYGKWIKW